MTGKIVASPNQEHRCFLFVPPEAGWFSPIGTRWQCDDCGAIWELVKGRGWQRVEG